MYIHSIAHHLLKLCILENNYPTIFLSNIGSYLAIENRVAKLSVSMSKRSSLIIPISCRDVPSDDNYAFNNILAIYGPLYGSLQIVIVFCLYPGYRTYYVAYRWRIRTVSITATRIRRIANCLDQNFNFHNRNLNGIYLCDTIMWSTYWFILFSLSVAVADIMGK